MAKMDIFVLFSGILDATAARLLGWMDTPSRPPHVVAPPGAVWADWGHSAALRRFGPFRRLGLLLGTLQDLAEPPMAVPADGNLEEEEIAAPRVLRRQHVLLRIVADQARARGLLRLLGRHGPLRNRSRCFSRGFFAVVGSCESASRAALIRATASRAFLATTGSASDAAFRKTGKDDSARAPIPPRHAAGASAPRSWNRFRPSRRTCERSEQHRLLSASAVRSNQLPTPSSRAGCHRCFPSGFLASRAGSRDGRVQATREQNSGAPRFAPRFGPEFPAATEQLPWRRPAKQQPALHRDRSRRYALAPCRPRPEPRRLYPSPRHGALGSDETCISRNARATDRRTRGSCLWASLFSSGRTASPQAAKTGTNSCQ